MILLPGNYFCDLIFTGLPAFPALGTEVYTEGLTVVPGGVLNTVVALHRLGVEVGWLGRLGNDFFSHFIADWLVQEGISLQWVERVAEPFRRVTVALSYPQDRAFISRVDPVSSTIHRLAAELETFTPTHLHFNHLVVDEQLPALLRRWQERGIFITMDCQHRPHTLADPLVVETLRAVNVFMPNAKEALHLTQTETLAAAAEVLLHDVPRLVIKDGAAGAHAWWEGSYSHQPALSVTPLDTTGAGDVFNAGFLAAYLGGKPIQECLQWGNIAGGLSTQGYGGCSTAPRLEELQTYL